MRFLRSGLAAFAAAAVLAGPGIAQSADDATKENGMTRIHVIVGDEVLNAVLDDTPAARDFASMLPLDLTFSDFHDTEKVADLGRKLDDTGAPGSYRPKAGDITQYRPWANLAIFYEPFRSSAGLLRLGEFEGSMDALLEAGDRPVRIEKAE